MYMCIHWLVSCACEGHWKFRARMVGDSENMLRNNSSDHNDSLYFYLSLRLTESFNRCSNINSTQVSKSINSIFFCSLMKQWSCYEPTWENTAGITAEIKNSKILYHGTFALSFDAIGPHIAGLLPHSFMTSTIPRTERSHVGTPYSLLSHCSLLLYKLRVKFYWIWY